MELSDLPTLGAGEKSRLCLVVLGMHRSGTSAVAGSLQRVGVEFGPRLMPPTADNTKGYYEHVDVVNLHDRLLNHLQRGWDSVAAWPNDWMQKPELTGRFRANLLQILRRDFGAAALWGIKDPRLCLLLPWWRPVWSELDTEPVFLVVVRDPAEVIASLQKRDRISTAKAALLWLQHMTSAERETRSHRRYFLDFSQMVDSWANIFAPLESVVGKQWRNMLARGRETIQGFLESRTSLKPTGTEEPIRALREVAKALIRGDEVATHSTLITARDFVGQAFVERSPQEQISDAEIELDHARHFATWYEAEWAKASIRAQQCEERVQRLASRQMPSK